MDRRKSGDTEQQLLILLMSLHSCPALDPWT
jgi:hypothetical protein